MKDGIQTLEIPDRARLASDPHRPHYHFSPPANWLNDPNGMIQWGETFHLFYQYNPNGPFHGTIHWGHASSEDLVHWQDHRVALIPQPDGADKDGCWSGCAVDDHGTPTFVYTGVYPQTVCLAMSHDGLETWLPYAGNPVIGAPPTEFAAQCGGDFRDPYVWREADGWYMVIGTRREGQGGLVLLYRSPDLKTWEFLRVLLGGDEKGNTRFYEGAMWECPNLIAFGDRRALIISAQDAQHRLHHPAYFAGPYRNHEFTPDTGGVLVYGHSFYAPQATRLADGRVLLFGWLRETRPLPRSIDAGWNGCMSLPLIVSMSADGELRVAPAAEVATLRGQNWLIREMSLPAHTEHSLDVQGAALEVAVTFETDGAAEYGIAVRCSPDGQEQTRIIVRPAQNELCIEHVGADPALALPAEHAPLALAPGQPLQLHLFVDGSVLEIFTENGVAMATRLYPQRSDSLGVTLFTAAAPVTVAELSAWRMASIW